MTALYVEIVATKGSAPRDAGTAMKVTPTAISGTIGGGALEYKAIARARTLLSTAGPDETRTLPLGPGLGQCCGGSVTLRFTRTPKPLDRIAEGRETLTRPREGAAPNLWLWGAGHVGRAVVRACPRGAFDLTWIDSAEDRFPTDVDTDITVIPTVDMARLAARAPTDAHHLIFTYSHDIDLALCAALLGRGFASCGLIGSDTKWARFQKRLRQAGLDPASITCPIGDKSLGKHPDAIAEGTVHALLAQAKAPA
ncbi:xanthine dehydrogenase accessory protein XdhC [Roseobacter sinensis]|uniref:Xanthine dehydrogenase accessory protein XdhC n=1 Tax=Roseobacter sinensis TaxID=2931391 RepID=A0ABT3BJ90_9RHOB|nr:xanthine dehydrogenase accessory protein XdhC [Roseobacter sp. WL0113]MCV3273645.1 xanthine dehydrogenase accessory protein XdhC [Roseobacter sp. WL0113]